MSTHLNIIISKKDLDLAVVRAGLAAMTEEGQAEISRASNETRGCIRISAVNGKIIFESSVSRFSTRHILSAGEDEATIVSEGETCVPAKELKIVAGKIKAGRKVSISFTPKAPDPTLNASPSAKAVLPDGVVEIGAISGSKVLSKTKIEAYPSASFAAPQYPETSNLIVVLSGKVACVKKPCSVVSFAVNAQDTKEVYNKFAVFTAQDGIYFVGSDGRRAAIVHSLAEKFDKFMDTETDAPILMDAEFLSPTLASLSDDDDLMVGLDKEQERVYLCSGQTTYCINMVNKALRREFPSYKRITDLPKRVVVLINRDELSETMELLGIVNTDRSSHKFCKDEMVIKMKGDGIGTVKESSGSIGFKLVSDDCIKKDTICLQTKYFLDGIKRMNCDNIRMTFTEDERKVVIEDETDPAFIYFMQVMASLEG